MLRFLLRCVLSVGLLDLRSRRCRRRRRQNIRLRLRAMLWCTIYVSVGESLPDVKLHYTDAGQAR